MVSGSDSRDVRRLRLLLAVFFIALALPTGLLIGKAYSQLSLEAIYAYQQRAAALVDRIDRELADAIAEEMIRPAADYTFVRRNGADGGASHRLSSLSVWPPSSRIPGLLGHFQVDDQGRLSAPFAPADLTTAAVYGVDLDEFAARENRRTQIESILAKNALIAGTRPAEGAPAADQSALFRESASAATDKELRNEPARESRAEPARAEVGSSADFDTYREDSIADNAPAPFAKQRLAQQKAPGLGSVASLKLDQRYQKTPATDNKSDSRRRPQGKDQLSEGREAKLESQRLSDANALTDEIMESEETDSAVANDVRIRMFDHGIAPMQLLLLQSGHLILYREVFSDGRRLIQGLMIDRVQWLQHSINAALRESGLAAVVDLLLVWRDEVIAVESTAGIEAGYASTEQISGTELYSARLSRPFEELTLIFNLRAMPDPPGALLLHWLSAVIAALLLGGFWALYRLGLRQIHLAWQQRDFVSAVSHELKTPLTSIRMYGEILREGWAGEEKKREYYEFIHDEAERLSRLINNVLQFARLSRGELQLSPRMQHCSELMDTLRSKLETQVRQAGFELNLECDAQAAGCDVRVDTDAFVQIMINLVDNALKFATGAERKRIDITCSPKGGKEIGFRVRDYGPGIPEAQQKKIFELFYRAGSELTRDAPGTGIGLALVRRLCDAMDARVEVCNRDPGAEFVIVLPLGTGD